MEVHAEEEQRFAHTDPINSVAPVLSFLFLFRVSAQVGPPRGRSHGGSEEGFPG
jgi:hypothetical protein